MDLPKDDPFAAVVVVTRQDGFVLAVTRRGVSTDLGLPGGKINEGETSEQAARRELTEETGIVAGDLTFLYSRNTSTKPVHVFRADTWVGSPSCQESGVDVVWAPWEDLVAKSSTFHRFNTELRKVLESMAAMWVP